MATIFIELEVFIADILGVHRGNYSIIRRLRLTRLAVFLTIQILIMMKINFDPIRTPSDLQESQRVIAQLETQRARILEPYSRLGRLTLRTLGLFGEGPLTDTNSDIQYLRRKIRYYEIEQQL